MHIKLKWRKDLASSWKLLEVVCKVSFSTIFYIKFESFSAEEKHFNFSTRFNKFSYFVLSVELQLNGLLRFIFIKLERRASTNEPKCFLFYLHTSQFKVDEIICGGYCDIKVINQRPKPPRNAQTCKKN